MTEDEAKKRIAAIEAMQTSFDNRLATLNTNLYTTLLAHADRILANPASMGLLFNKFNQAEHVPVLQQFGLDLLTIKNLNDGYFQGAVGDTLGGVAVNTALFENVQQQVEKLITDRFGIKPNGDIVSGGLFDLFSQDTTVRRQIQQFAYTQKAAGVGLQKFTKNLKSFVQGEPSADGPGAQTKGVWSRHYNTVAYDTYQQADRVAQQAFAEGLNMSAFLYLGGTIQTTRLFCRVRDGKVFLRSEIDKFGTSTDTYGGYENKAIGYFSGKPKSAYAPFTDAGGYSCRHHFSAISDREALRRRADLQKGTGGKLQLVRTPQPVQQPQQQLSDDAKKQADEAKKQAALLKAQEVARAKAEANDLKEKTAYLKSLPEWKDYIKEVKRQKYKTAFPGLSQMQAATINGYTSSDFYGTFNRYLIERSTNPSLKESPKFEAISKVLGNALESIPTKFNGLTYRGVNLTTDQIKRYQVAADSGQHLVEPFFISTSKSLTKSFSGNVKFYIEGKSGRYINDISQSPTELEVLIPAGKSFRVTQIFDLGRVMEIYMEEI